MLILLPADKEVIFAGGGILDVLRRGVDSLAVFINHFDAAVLAGVDLHALCGGLVAFGFLEQAQGFR